VTNPTNTVYATKRLIGRAFKDEQTQKEMKVSVFQWLTWQQPPDTAAAAAAAAAAPAGQQ
jgi:molecular chaperone DnaK (HSP70)